MVTQDHVPPLNTAAVTMHQVLEGTRDFPDSYVCPRASGPQAFGIHIRQITRTCVTIISYIAHYKVANQ